MEWDIKQVAHA